MSNYRYYDHHYHFFTLHHGCRTPEEMLGVVIVYAVVGVFLGIASLVNYGIEKYDERKARKAAEFETLKQNYNNNLENSLENQDKHTFGVELENMIKDGTIKKLSDSELNQVVDKLMQFDGLHKKYTIKKQDGFFRRLFKDLFGLEDRYEYPELAKRINAHKEKTAKIKKQKAAANPVPSAPPAHKLSETQATSTLTFSTAAAKVVTPSAPPQDQVDEKVKVKVTELEKKLLPNYASNKYKFSQGTQTYITRLLEKSQEPGYKSNTARFDELQSKDPKLSEPEDLICPLSHELINFPVSLNGKYYELEKLVEALLSRRGQIDPCTRQLVDFKEIVLVNDYTDKVEDFFSDPYKKNARPKVA